MSGGSSMPASSPPTGSFWDTSCTPRREGWPQPRLEGGRPSQPVSDRICVRRHRLWWHHCWQPFWGSNQGVGDKIYTCKSFPGLVLSDFQTLKCGFNAVILEQVRTHCFSRQAHGATLGRIFFSFWSPKSDKQWKVLRNCPQCNQTFPQGGAPWESLITLETSQGQIFPDNPFKLFTVRTRYCSSWKSTWPACPCRIAKSCWAYLLKVFGRIFTFTVYSILF